MKIIAITFLVLIPSMASASWPTKCESALLTLFNKLEQRDSLSSPSDVIPDENYIEDGRPRSCIVKTKMPYNWLIEMHNNNVTVIIHRYEFKTMESVYFGPYQSAYNK